jgi:cold shock CspA family protein
MIKGRIKRATDEALEAGPQVSFTQERGATGARIENVKPA